ncbi:hypothetical protein HDU84_002103 [Entophlyctis sp. JEL0112]|nr:hypothetical protein HDU84_002103 [Entophlyctis sp. JEL0112]
MSLHPHTQTIETQVPQISMLTKLRDTVGTTSTDTLVTAQIPHNIHTVEELESDSLVLTNAFRESFDGNFMNIKFSGLNYVLAGKTLLENVGGEFKAGRMVSIIGPSGVGKSTFLNTVMGKIGKVDGKITVNGDSVSLSTLKKLIGYVPQDDIMTRELTVKEVIHYSARMRLPRKWSNDKVDSFVDSILHLLNLTNIGNNFIGDELKRGISGGQRKRVNIGMELAAAPLALFLDEPTSGVDSTSALQITKILRRLSRIGLTVVCIIHQPGDELFNTFDDVCMFEEGGKLAYFGPVKDAKSYFEGQGFSFEGQTNLPHAYMNILSGLGVVNADFNAGSGTINVESESSSPKQQVDLSGPSNSENSSQPTFIQETIVNVEETADASAVLLKNLKYLAKQRGASFWSQVNRSCYRAIIQQVRTSFALVTEVIVAIGAGLIIGIAAQKDEIFHGILLIPFRQLSSPSNDYMVALYGTLVGISVGIAAGPAGVRIFGENKLVYWREASSGLNTLAYFLGQNLSSIFRISLTALHFTAVYVYFTKPTFSIGLHGISMLVSMAMRRDVAPLMAVVISLLLALLNGSAPSLKSAREAGIEFLFALSPSRWATEAQYGLSLEIYDGIYDLNLSVSLFGYELQKTSRNLGVMAALGIGYRAVAYVLMVLMNRDKQR